MTTTKTRTPALTKRRRKRAVAIFLECRDQLVPTLVTAQEASWLCDDYGMITSKYHKMRKEKPIRLIDACVYIARNTTVA